MRKFQGVNFKNYFGMNKTRNKLILAFLVPVILIIALGIISYIIASEGLINSYETAARSATQGKADFLAYNVDSLIQTADVLVENDVIKKYLSDLYKNDPGEQKARWGEVTSLVSKQILAQKFITNIYLLSQNGEYYSGNGSIFKDFDYAEFMKQEGSSLADEGKDRVWIGENTYLDQMTGGNKSDYAFSYLASIKNVINQPIGCLVINVSTASIQEIIDNADLPKGSFVGMITSDGREVFTGSIKQDFNLSEQSFYKAHKVNSDQNGSQYVDLMGKKYLYTYTKNEKSGCTMCTFVPESKILEKANQLKLVTIILILFAVFIATALGAFIANGYSRTLDGVNRVLHKVEKGDLSLMTEVKRRDEFRILGDCINDVIKSMGRLIMQMKNSSDTVSESALTLSDNSSILVSATENMVRAIKDIENGVVQQAEDAETSLMQMNDLVERVNDLYERTHNIERIANNTTELVKSGMSSVDNLSEKANDTKQVTKTVIGDIEKLEMEIGAISGILETMSGIADQTNLLSLNASIEAAQAGEYGRGFAVVAYEIRKLAEQSVKASSEIAKIIGRINNQTKLTVKSALHADNIVSSQEMALSQTISSFTDINRHIGDLNENLNKMVCNVEGIEKVKNDTLKSIESISATTEESAAASEELNASATNQLQTVNALDVIVQKLKNDSELLMHEVSIFHIDEVAIINEDKNEIIS